MRNPLTGRPLPLLVDDTLVHMDETPANAVKVTPRHDFDDYLFGQRHHVDGPAVIDLQGRMTSVCGRYAGEDRFVTRRETVEELRRKGL